MTKPFVKGWCPGAHRPMASGDGLLVRIRPKLGQLTKYQIEKICKLSSQYGSGIIEFTSRANLQLRGVNETTHPEILNALAELDLLDPDPATEARSNISVAPDWVPGGLNQKIAHSLNACLAELPKLPAKFGFAIDVGPIPRLQGVSADIRVERTSDGDVIVCLDGCRFGQPVEQKNIIQTIIGAANWFVATGGDTAKRMRRHIKQVSVPKEWHKLPRSKDNMPMTVGTSTHGQIIGIPFGQCKHNELAELVTSSEAEEIRITPWRSMILVGAKTVADSKVFITNPSNPLLNVSACPGKSFCPSATVDTRALARALAQLTEGDLHVSGCSKGCAKPKASSVTLVGERGMFNLIRNGCADDTPQQTGLSPMNILQSADLL